jgi:hypothetical protein
VRGAGALAIAGVCALAAAAAADPAQLRFGARQAYLGRALAAVRGLGATGRARLERDVSSAARTRCHADAAPPTAACAIEAARATCAGEAACVAAADVIASNLRSVDDFVDEATRARLVRGASDYHAALVATLRQRYALLAAELALGRAGRDDPADEAGAIDHLCLERDRAVHVCAPGDAGCIPSLPWSRCAAALIWYLGSDGDPR